MDDEDWSQYYEVLSDEEMAAWEARRAHLQRLRRITPERYALILRALRDAVEYQPHFDPNPNGPDAYVCDHCGASMCGPVTHIPMYIMHEPPDFTHNPECWVPGIKTMLQELEEESPKR